MEVMVEECVDAVWNVITLLRLHYVCTDVALILQDRPDKTGWRRGKDGVYGGSPYMLILHDLVFFLSAMKTCVAWSYVAVQVSYFHSSRVRVHMGKTGLDSDTWSLEVFRVSNGIRFIVFSWWWSKCTVSGKTYLSFPYAILFNKRLWKVLAVCCIFLCMSEWTRVIHEPFIK